MSEEESFQNEIAQLKKNLKRRLKKAKKYLEKQMAHLNKCLSWKKIHHEAELLQIYFSINRGINEGSEIVLEDWETGQAVTIALTSGLKSYEEIAKKFKAAKKFRLGVPFAEKEVEKAKAYLCKCEECICNIETVRSPDDLQQFQKDYPFASAQKKLLIPPKEREFKKPYFEFLSSSKIPIWVGKSASMNDLLTFSHARGNDIWLHVVGVPGSHVVIRVSEDNLDRKTLEEALQLALYYSKARSRGEAEVAMTSVKYVRRMGQMKGKVQVAKEKRFFVRLDQEMLEKLK